jgi:O-methyltransferase
MDNYFLASPPYAINKLKRSALVDFVNKGLRFMRVGYQVNQMDTSVDMNSIEQRINYYHLLNSVILDGVAGEVVELGCFTGQCALIFQKVIELNSSERQLHLYDSFFAKFTVKGDIEKELKANFEKAGLKQPIVHKGDFDTTLPDELPPAIAFAHIDCGYGGDKMEHKAVMMHCFESIYPRMTKNSICIMMDYYDASAGTVGPDLNPGVKLAYDDFFAGKPEKIICLWGNQSNHAYFRKE